MASFRAPYAVPDKLDGTFDYAPRTTGDLAGPGGSFRGPVFTKGAGILADIRINSEKINWCHKIYSFRHQTISKLLQWQLKLIIRFGVKRVQNSW